MHQDTPSLLPPDSESSDFPAFRRRSRASHRAWSDSRQHTGEESQSSGRTIRGKSVALLPEDIYCENSRNQEKMYKFPAVLMLRLLLGKRNKAWPQTHHTPSVKLVNIQCPQVLSQPKHTRHISKLRAQTSVSPLLRKHSPVPSSVFISRRLKGVQPRDRLQPLKVPVTAT